MLLILSCKQKISIAVTTATIACAGRSVLAQDKTTFSPRQGLTLGLEYSNTSSHILLGSSFDRRILGVNGAASRRLIHSSVVDWNYEVFISPIKFIQEPVVDRVTLSDGSSPAGQAPASFSGPIQRKCVSGVVQGVGYVSTQQCGMRWTYIGSVSPLGQRVNFRPRKQLQPLIAGNAGVLLASRNIPSVNAARLNFVFEFGVGVEYFLQPMQAVTLDYRIQHISNGYRASENPGIDNQVVRLSYTFGR